MIIIYGIYTQVEIPDNTEYAITHTDYFCDKDGNILSESRGDSYACGDLRIETPSCRYTFRKIYDCYAQCANLNRYIRKQRKQQKQLILVDLEKIASQDAALAELVAEKL